MKVQQMSEPISGAAAGAVGWKIIGGLAGMGAIGAALAAFVVMAMTKPKTEQEWRVALACTFVGSLGGGAALIKYLGVEHWSNDVLGLVAQGGLIFTCGLPAWTLIRALFKYLEKRKDADIVEIANDVKGVL
jgi:hypothetical protein